MKVTDTPRENPNCDTPLECKLLSITITSLPATACHFLQVFAVSGELGPSVRSAVPGSHNHEGKEGAHEGVVPV